MNDNGKGATNGASHLNPLRFEVEENNKVIKTEKGVPIILCEKPLENEKKILGENPILIQANTNIEKSSEIEKI